MTYLIDTDYALDHLNGVPEVVALLDALSVDGTAISIVTYMEIAQGIEYRSLPSGAWRELTEFTASAAILPLSVEVARRFARTTADLMRRGRRVRSRVLDLSIAATALEHDLTLVTRNVDDYKDIPGLKLYRPS